MPRRAFTLIEVMVAVVLLGLLAAAVAWSLAGDARDVARGGAFGQIAHADRMTRLAAQCRGRPCLLSFDLDAHRIQRWMVGERGRREAAHPLAIPPEVRIDRVEIARAGPGSGRGRGWPAVSAGKAEIPFSARGRSVTYAVRLAPRRATGRGAPAERNDTGWIVVSGLTGQATLIEHDRDIDKLFSLLTAGGLDAD